MRGASRSATRSVNRGSSLSLNSRDSRSRPAVEFPKGHSSRRSGPSRRRRWLPRQRRGCDAQWDRPGGARVLPSGFAHLEPSRGSGSTRRSRIFRIPSSRIPACRSGFRRTSRSRRLRVVRVQAPHEEATRVGQFLLREGCDRSLKHVLVVPKPERVVSASYLRRKCSCTVVHVSLRRTKHAVGLLLKLGGSLPEPVLLRTDLCLWRNDRLAVAASESDERLGDQHCEDQEQPAVSRRGYASGQTVGSREPNTGASTQRYGLNPANIVILPGRAGLFAWVRVRRSAQLRSRGFSHAIASVMQLCGSEKWSSFG